MDIRQVYWHTDDPDEMGAGPFAYCPLCGGRLVKEMVDHRFRKVCPDCGFIHFRNPAPTVSLLIINVTDSFFPPEQHFLNIYLLAQVIGGQLQSGDDMGELRWFPLSGPFPEMAFQEDIDLLESYRQDRSYLPVQCFL